jgi:hypothetical protein
VHGGVSTFCGARRGRPVDRDDAPDVGQLCPNAERASRVTVLGDALPRVAAE